MKIKNKNATFMSSSKNNNSKKILNEYKNLLDILKTSLTYIAVFSAITIIFGIIHILGYLYAGNNFWLLGSIKYTTVVSWGIPLALIFAISWVITISAHLYLDMRKLVPITITFTLIIIIIILMSMFSIGNIFIQKTTILYISFFIISLLLSLQAGRIINDTNSLKRRTFKLIMFMIPSVLIFAIFAIGIRDFKELNNNDMIVKFNSKTWKILLNNSDSFILTDANNSNIIKIVPNDRIEYFQTITE